MGAPGRIRTRDPLLRRQPLYPTELQALGDSLCIAKVTRRPHYGVGPITVGGSECLSSGYVPGETRRHWESCGQGSLMRNAQ
jgi:hypothetical protein